MKPLSAIVLHRRSGVDDVTLITDRPAPFALGWEAGLSVMFQTRDAMQYLRGQWPELPIEEVSEPENVFRFSETGNNPSSDVEVGQR